MSTASEDERSEQKGEASEEGEGREEGEEGEKMEEAIHDSKEC